MLLPNVEQCSALGSAGFTNSCTIMNAKLLQSNAQKSTFLKLSTLEKVVDFNSEDIKALINYVISQRSAHFKTETNRRVWINSS